MAQALHLVEDFQGLEVVTVSFCFQLKDIERILKVDESSTCFQHFPTLIDLVQNPMKVDLLTCTATFLGRSLVMQESTRLIQTSKHHGEDQPCLWDEKTGLAIGCELANFGQLFHHLEGLKKKHVGATVGFHCWL